MKNKIPQKSFILFLMGIYVSGIFNAHSESLIPPQDVLVGEVISFAYDQNGNRIRKEFILRDPLKSQELTEENEATDAIFYDQVADYSIVIYPNPTKGQLTIGITGYDNLLKGKISIYNSSGQLINTENIVSDEIYFDLTSNPSGIYMLIIDINGKKTDWKVIKE